MKFFRYQRLKIWEIKIITIFLSCYEKININEIETNQLRRDSFVMIDNSISKRCVTHSLYMDIYNSLYNNMKNDEQISNVIIGLLLEFKQIVNSKDEKFKFLTIYQK